MGSEYFKDRVRAFVRPQNLYATKKPKVFKTEESAKKWAESNGMKDYDIVNVRKGEGKPKLKVIKKR